MDALTYAGLWQFSEMFAAHHDAYVRDSRYHVDEPITPELLYDAYVNHYAVSGYTARLKDDVMVTRLGAIDFDHADPAQIGQVRDTLKKVGIPYLVSQSSRGDHLWIHVKEGEVPAAVVRGALTHAIRLTDPALLKTCEVFPKMSTAPFGVGALRFPLMTHPKAKVSFPCYDMDNHELRKLVDIVVAMDYTPLSALANLASQAPIEYPRGLGEYRRRTNIEPGSVVSLLAEMGVTATLGHSCRCPFHEDKKASLSVAADDERVWCKSPECPAYNGGRGVGTLGLAKMVRERK